MAQENRTIPAIFVLFNTTESDIKNITGMLGQFPKVFLIDNSPEKAKDLDDLVSSKTVEYFHFPENIGFGAAMNFACKKAKEAGFNHAIILNPDSFMPIDGFYKFIDLVNTYKEASIIAPQYIFDRGGKVELTDEVKEIEICMQSGCIYNLDILEKLGYFEESFIVDGEDHDYCCRCVENGYHNYQAMFYAIIHQPAITKKTKLLHVKYGYCSPTRIYYQSRNMRELAKRHKVKRLYITLFRYWKHFKIVFFFDNKKEFLKMWRLGRRDFRNRKFGKLGA